eukprot:427302_1
MVLCNTSIDILLAAYNLCQMLFAAAPVHCSHKPADTLIQLSSHIHIDILLAACNLCQNNVMCCSCCLVSALLILPNPHSVHFMVFELNPDSWCSSYCYLVLLLMYI